MRPQCTPDWGVETTNLGLIMPGSKDCLPYIPSFNFEILRKCKLTSCNPLSDIYKMADTSALHWRIDITAIWHTGLTTPKRGTLSKHGVYEKVPALRDNYSMEGDLFKYSHTSHERASIVNVFQWHDGKHCYETDKERIFKCEWSYCVLPGSGESFDIFIESKLFRLLGVQFSGGKNHEAQTLPFKAYMMNLLAEHCGKGKRWVYVAWYAHASLWKIPMAGWDLQRDFLAYLDNIIHPYFMQIFVSM